MKKDFLADIFDDADDIAVTWDAEGIVKIKGIGIRNDISYRITVSRNDSGNPSLTCGQSGPRYKPLYTGTVSLLSPKDDKVLLSEVKRRKFEEKRKPYKEKNIYASSVVRCDSADPNKLASTICRQMESLFEANKGQLEKYLFETIRPNQVSPQFCAAKYVDDFLRLSYPDSKPERNASRKRAIQKIFSLLPHMPMCTIKAKDIAALVRKENITTENVTLCRLFWEHLLSHGKCTGKNPFPSQDLRIPSTEGLNRKAFTSEEIDPPVYAKFLSLVTRKKTGLNCAVALLTSGFDMYQVTALCWKDIEFVDGFSDFAIVHIQRDKTVTSKHDYSRPVIPAIAKYMKTVYDENCQKVGPEKVAGMKVAVDLTGSKPKSAESEEIANEVHNLLVRAGYTGSLSKSGRPTTDAERIPFAILKKNYQRMLLSVAGLGNDADTFNFLAGRQMVSSTFINYESHVCPEAQVRFYTILKSLSPEKKLSCEKPLREGKNGLIFKAVPATTHEAVQITGQLSLKAGDQLVIRVPHGVTGWVEAK